MQKPSFRLQETTIGRNVSNEITKPENPPANILSAESYVLEVDGKLKSEYATFMEALKAGLELKNKYSQIQVKVYDAKERMRTSAELIEQSHPTS
jgi:hypothetical protein